MTCSVRSHLHVGPATAAPSVASSIVIRRPNTTSLTTSPAFVVAPCHWLGARAHPAHPHTRTDYFSPDSDVVRSSTWTTSDVHCVGDDDSQYLTDVLDWAHVSSIAVGVENNYVRRGVVPFPRAVILLVAIREGKQAFSFPFFALRSDLCTTCSLARFSGSHDRHAMPPSALRPISHLSHPARRPAQPEHGRLAAPGRRPRAALDALVEPRFVRL